MALQIANPAVVEKVERLARATGMTKTALVEKAVDSLARETEIHDLQGHADTRKLEALLAQLDRIPDRQDAYDPLTWDKDGLPE
jgi:antitoxin VapB